MERASLFDGITEFPCGDSVFYYPEVKSDACPLFWRLLVCMIGSIPNRPKLSIYAEISQRVFHRIEPVHEPVSDAQDDKRRTEKRQHKEHHAPNIRPPMNRTRDCRVNTTTKGVARILRTII